MSGYEDSDQPAAAYSAAVAGWLHQVYHAQMMHYGSILHLQGISHLTLFLILRLPQLPCISSLKREVALTTAATTASCSYPSSTTTTAKYQPPPQHSRRWQPQS